MAVNNSHLPCNNRGCLVWSFMYFLHVWLATAPMWRFYAKHGHVDLLLGVSFHAFPVSLPVEIFHNSLLNKMRRRNTAAACRRWSSLCYCYQGGGSADWWKWQAFPNKLDMYTSVSDRALSHNSANMLGIANQW